MCKLYNWIKRFLMGKINNTAAYASSTPTSNTLLIGSEQAGGATKNYLVSEISAFLNLNPTLSTLSVTGNATIGGTLGVTGATTLGNASVTNTLGVTGATTMTTAQVNSLTVVSTATVVLSAFDDDAAAGAGGLTSGRLYQTTGAGAAPLNAAGIVMVKQ